MKPFQKNSRSTPHQSHPQSRKPNFENPKLLQTFPSRNRNILNITKGKTQSPPVADLTPDPEVLKP